MKDVFTENQKFKQPWLWVIMIGVTLIPIIGIIQQVILDKPFGNKPAPDMALYVMLIICLGLCALFYFMHLQTTIDQQGITVQFFPLATKKVNWNEIQNVTVVDYGFVGGWGIRLGTKYGTVYNMAGRKGLAIELKNGKKFLVGTQQETALKEFLENR